MGEFEYAWEDEIEGEDGACGNGANIFLCYNARTE